jgi:hypothetical protein
VILGFWDQKDFLLIGDAELRQVHLFGNMSATWWIHFFSFFPLCIDVEQPERLGCRPYLPLAVHAQTTTDAAHHASIETCRFSTHIDRAMHLRSW